MTTTRESRPAASISEAARVQHGIGPQSTGATSDPHSIGAPFELWVLLVTTPTDRVSRRVFLSLHSAVKACERAQARGHAATLELLHATPADGGAR